MPALPAPEPAPDAGPPCSGPCPGCRPSLLRSLPRMPALPAPEPAPGAGPPCSGDCPGCRPSCSGACPGCRPSLLRSLPRGRPSLLQILPRVSALPAPDPAPCAGRRPCMYVWWCDRRRYIRWPRRAPLVGPGGFCERCRPPAVSSGHRHRPAVATVQTRRTQHTRQTDRQIQIHRHT